MAAAPTNSDPVATLSAGGYRFLRYWSVNIWLAQRGSWSFPGFSYTDAETERIKALADAASREAVIAWLAATVVIYLALAGALMIGLSALLSSLFPNPADLPAAGFFGALILAVVGVVALGLPLSISLGGRVADLLSRPPPPPGAGDAALAAKVGRQFRRMGLVIAIGMAAALLGWNCALQRH